MLLLVHCKSIGSSTPVLSLIFYAKNGRPSLGLGHSVMENQRVPSVFSQQQVCRLHIYGRVYHANLNEVRSVGPERLQGWSHG